MKRIILVVVLFLLSSNFVFSQYNISTVPDPAKTGGYVSNPDGILSQNIVDSLNVLLKKADDSGYVQTAIVILNSVGETDAKTFATDLFNYWGIGQEGKDNGLLILAVMDQRTISFETGYGIEDVLTDAECYTIQQDYMVPFFKDEQYDQGVLNGVIIALSEIENNSTIYNNPPPTEDDDIEYYNYNSRNHSTHILKSDGFILYSLITIGFFLLFLIFLLSAFMNKDRYKRYQAIRLFSLIIFPILFPIPFIPIFIFVKVLMERWRNTPRISPSGKIMRKLDEEADDEFLKSGQVTEEQVKSIDYDVWITDDKKETLILAYKRWFSSYSACPKCKFKTYYQEYDKVIRAATYTNSGEGEKKHSCKHCGHSVTRRYTIPKKERTSSTSSSYSSFGGGSRSSSSWGGSSSRSWGGGSSGGGGASSKW